MNQPTSGSAIVSRSVPALLSVALLALAGAAHAQVAAPQAATAQAAAPQVLAPPDACPQLPANSGLAWQHKASANSDFCRAIREDGSEAFGLYIASDSPFKPNRSDREEQSSIDGREVYWYRSELANQPNVQARETLVELGNGRMAHMWIQAGSPEQLNQALQQTQALRFPQTRLSSN